MRMSGSTRPSDPGNHKIFPPYFLRGLSLAAVHPEMPPKKTPMIRRSLIHDGHYRGFQSFLKNHSFDVEDGQRVLINHYATLRRCSLHETIPACGISPVLGLLHGSCNQRKIAADSSARKKTMSHLWVQLCRSMFQKHPTNSHHISERTFLSKSAFFARPLANHFRFTFRCCFPFVPSHFFFIKNTPWANTAQPSYQTPRCSRCKISAVRGGGTLHP